MQYSIDRPRQVQQSAPHQLGPRHLLSVLFRRRWTVLGVALPIIVVATVGTLRTADSVTAAARVMIQARQPESPTFDNVQPDYTLLMSSAAQIGMSIPVADKAAATLLDSLGLIAKLHPRLAAVRGRQELRDLLLAGVDCSQVGESSILRIRYKHTSPEFALVAARAMMNAYIDFTIESQQNLQAVVYYDEQIRFVENGIDSLIQRRSEFRDEGGFSAFAANAQAAITQVYSLEQDLARARSRREGLQARLEQLEAAVRTDPDYAPAFGAGQSAIVVGLKNRLEDLRAKLEELRTQYTDDAEWVHRQRALIEEARMAFRRERDNYIRDQQIDLAEAVNAERSYAEAITSLKAQLVGYPKIEARVDELDMRITTQRELLRSLQVKRGEVRLKAQSDSRVSSIVVLNQPVIETIVASSKKMLYLILASFFAVALGVIGAFFLDNQDHRLYDRQQVEAVLEVPVLASVSDAEHGIQRTL